ncbi:aspartyl-tRNA(Asn)/glutamyl-tRNA(Gln) amidotransferase subunit A [Humitalea rosea]|uniref:Aspartyl-tRNA(Asn)/glutamyl-tRNA(Gln) amidotransferase subunit A n=1 Tax=Humitalea rosea TaxID=990373 RepID=A0A2W7ISK8_9PROT|nr:amidase family protein [Humitalea rosea]PZW50836.1 aspartyl-tRNA(Asn)/glutamyl-tRNA(Gln) amidotransferase subunit A [Humitalea rosea]
MADADLLFMPATRAAALIRRRALSPVELTRAVLAAIDRAQPRLNAFATVLHEQAMAAATRAEQAVMDGAALGPLHGVPVHIKDQVDTEGVVTAHGSAIFAGNLPARDDATAARLKAAGGILLGKTTMPEFGHKGLTDGPSFGTTRNPWDLSRTTGGSSGGAAAAVAAGLGPIGLGTDGAGSVRIPAACCGIVGLKATLGAVPWEASADTFGNNVYAGPMTRTVTDAAVMFSIIAGPSARDAQSLRGPGLAPVPPGLIGGDLNGLRIGYIAKACNAKVQAEMAANTIASLDALSARGALVEEVTDSIDWMEYQGRILYQAGFFVSCTPHLAQWHNQMDPVLLAFMERGSKFSLTQYREAQFARTRLFRAIQGLFERYDVLVTPTLTRTALAADFDAADGQIEIDGEACGITRQGWTSYMYPFNLTGHPALTIPSGFAGDGLPTAVQLVGPWGGDMSLLRLGALLEQDRPWAQHRPPAG